MVSLLYLHIYILFTIMARMVEGCRNVRNVGKVKKGCAFRLRVAT